jgi:hypothetical protein
LFNLPSPVKLRPGFPGLVVNSRIGMTIGL